MVTNIEIRFMPADKCHAYALSRNTMHLRLDGHAGLLLHAAFFATLLNREGAFHGMCGP